MSAVPEGDVVVTRSFLERVLQLTGQAIGKEIRAAIAPLSTRLSACEVRAGAMAMMLVGKGPAAGRLTEVETLLARVADLETRLKGLESRPELAYRGIWKDGVGFERGSLVTHGGSMFFCNAATMTKPGTSSAWVLAVKHGKDLR